MFLFSAVAGAAAADARVTVFAAASLQGALEEIALGYTAPVTYSYAGSGTIARQIAAGAPADLVILASPAWADWLVAQGIPDVGEAVDIAANTLVVVAPVGATALADASDLPSRLGTGRLAMGHREAVPAGAYAREWLENAGLWNALQQRLVETDNVRAALALVARGEAPLGIVYATDAQADDSVDVVLAVPATAHAPIRYPAAALTPAGAAYLDHLRADTAQAILARHGFATGTR